jgi:hypothetical protein
MDKTIVSPQTSTLVDWTNLNLRRSILTDIEAVRPKHIAMASVAGTQALRDFGGTYSIHGQYLLESALKVRAKFVSMIDVNPVPEFYAKIAKVRESLPDLQVEFINSDFRLSPLYEVLRPVDVSLLYNVLLHQENYMGVLNGVCRTTKKFICVAQPCLKEEYFQLPCSATMLQFWEEELKDKFRGGAYWPKLEPSPRFSTVQWIWGHTISHLVACFKGFGWELDDGEVVENLLGSHWDYPLLRFKPAYDTSKFCLTVSQRANFPVR